VHNKRAATSKHSLSAQSDPHAWLGSSAPHGLQQLQQHLLWALQLAAAPVGRIMQQQPLTCIVKQRTAAPPLSHGLQGQEVAKPEEQCNRQGGICYSYHALSKSFSVFPTQISCEKGLAENLKGLFFNGCILLDKSNTQTLLTGIYIACNTSFKQARKNASQMQGTLNEI
jgi:hypothetical protein